MSQIEQNTVDLEEILDVINELPEAPEGGGDNPTPIDEIDAEKVFFSRNLTTTKEIGNITLINGQATIPAIGKNLVEVWNTIFVQEKNPSTTDPSVSLTFNQAKSYEVGTKVTPSYSATFDSGSYTYGPATGIEVTEWTITDTKGNTKNDASGSFPELQVTDGISYKITAKADHTAGAIPVTNVGNEYADGKIPEGSQSATSGALTGYRNSFYGAVANKDAVTSSVIRGLTKSGKALANGNSFTVTVSVGALRVIIAYPSTLRDVTSIKDVNASSAEISPSFKMQTIDVPGANGYDAKTYKVYTMDFAEPYKLANKFTVTI